MDKLTVVVDSLGTANKALKELVQVSDEEDRLENFEVGLEDLNCKFRQFKSIALEHDKKADRLQKLFHERLDQGEKQAENLRHQIISLKSDIAAHNRDIEKLEKDLRDNVDVLGRLKFSKFDDNGQPDSTYANAPILGASHKTVSSPNSFIERLYNENKQRE